MSTYGQRPPPIDGQRGVFLKAVIEDEAILISDLSMITEFELDLSIHSFAPNFHYKVIPDSFS